ncbi:hypothetical protein [Psychrobacillus antarcticus]|uniref:hypothetical protein n=1 Tax=Psychrobacillus antarcticus TaxID=2879115 RepID=UPI002407C763|nr:hypothetical protein [Psychrobacillus antarcticus]
MKKLVSVMLATFLVISISLLANESASAQPALSKIMWGKTELKIGQLGKVTILEDTPLVKQKTDGKLETFRILKKGDEYRVYTYKSMHNGLYGVGANSFVPKNAKIKYETPSKKKLELLSYKKLFQEARNIQIYELGGDQTRQELLKVFDSHFTEAFALQYISHHMSTKEIDGVRYYYYKDGSSLPDMERFVDDNFSWKETTTVTYYQVPTIHLNKKYLTDHIKISEYQKEGKFTYTIILMKMDDGIYKISDVKREY